MKLYEIELHAKDRQRGEAMGQELAAWQQIFGGTTTMISNTVLRWHPDDNEFSTFDPMSMLVDRMVEFGVINTATDTWQLLEREHVGG